MTNMTNDLTEFEFVNHVRNRLQMWLALSRVIEETLADLVAAYTPLLAPIIPAAIGFENVRNGLGFGIGLALVYAVVVEFLGLATTTTTLQFRAWNQEQSKKAPLWLAILMAAFYLAVVLTVNVALDTGTDLQKWVKAAASTFSIVGAVTMALRNEQAKRVAALAAQKVEQAQQIENDLRTAERLRLEAEERAYQRKVADEERERAYQLKLEQQRAGNEFKLKKLEKVVEKPVETFQKVPEPVAKVPETFGKWKDWRKLPESEKKVIATFERPEQVSENYGVESKTAANWLKNAKEVEAA